MSSFPPLDVAIGLTFIYLLLAIACTTIMEWIAQILNLRGRMLVQGTKRLLGEQGSEKPTLTDRYLAHPLIQTLADGERKPSYVPASVFAKVLGEIWRTHGAEGDVPERLRGTLKALAATEKPDAPPASLPSEKALAEWYEQFMQRLSGTYKRRTRWVLLFLALGVTLGLNADSVVLTQTLWSSPTLRQYMVDSAKERLAQGPPLQTLDYTEPDSAAVTRPVQPPDTSASADRLQPQEAALIGQLFGWSGERAKLTQQGLWGWLLRHTLGWMLTALAVSLGAPFWFDLLNKFMGLRSTGPAPTAAVDKKKGGT